MLKIFISDPLAKKGVDILRKNKNFSIHEEFGLTEMQLVKKIKGYDAIIIRSTTTLTKKVIDASDKLKVIGRAGVGVDNVNMSAASKKGIVVVNAPTSNTISTAEHAFALMMALSRNIPRADQSLKSGLWNRKGFIGVELYRKTLGIVGLGRIGETFAKRAQSFEMEILAYDPFLTEEKAKSINVVKTSLKTLLKKSDFITIHTPLTNETRNLIDADAFKLMKKNVRIVNAARGGIVDEKALAKYIRSGKVKGAAIDVYASKMKPPMDSPIILMNEVITTPHLGSATSEAQLNVAVDIAECVSDVLQNKGYRNAVNVPVLDEDMMKKTGPYLKLAESLGRIETQRIDEPIKSVKIKYTGDIARFDTSVITRALVKGIFDDVLDEHVNYVNSLVIAKDRGIKVEEKKTSEITDFNNLITVEIVSGKKRHLIMGTLFANNEPRIVRIDAFYLEAIPEGFMLVTTNKDVPGIVGKVGTILGSSGINIASVSLGRNKTTKEAISLIKLDCEVSKKIMKKLKAVKEIKEVKQVKLI